MVVKDFQNQKEQCPGDGTGMVMREIQNLLPESKLTDYVVSKCEEKLVQDERRIWAWDWEVARSLHPNNTDESLTTWSNAKSPKPRRGREYAMTSDPFNEIKP